MRQTIMLFALLAAALLPTATRAQSYVTVAEGDETPIYTLTCYADMQAQQQCVYPASMLGDLVGSQIVSLKWYTNQVLDDGIPGVVVKMMEVAADDASYFQNTDAAQTVWTGMLHSSTDELEITLDNPYTYTGGNLLIEVSSPTSSEYDCSVYFYGMYYDYGYYIRYYDEGWDHSSDDLLLQVTFGIESVGDCPTPRQLAIGGLSADEATLSWVGNDNADEYTVYLDGEEYDATSDTFYTFTGLDPNTAYTAGVSAICSDEATAIRSISFRTLCDAVALPWTEDFESTDDYGTPLCWQMVRTYNDDGDIFPYVDESANYAHNSDKYLYTMSGEDGDSIIIATPMFNHPGNELEVEFWSVVWDEARMKAGVMTNPYDPSTFVELVSYDNSLSSDPTPYTLFYFNTANLDITEPVCLAIRTWGYVDIDDVSAWALTDCQRPTGGSVADIAETSATLSWSGSAGQYILRLQRPDGTDTLIDGITDTAYTADWLRPASGYTAQVAAVCGSDTTAFTLIGAFRTPCVTLTEEDLPYSENFDSYGSGSSAGIDPCWTKFTQYSSNYPYPYNYQHHGTSGNSLYFYNGDQNRYNYAALPPFESLAGLMVSFWTYTFSPTQVQIQVGTMTDPTDATTFTPLYTTPTTMEANTWVDHEVVIPDTVTAQYVAFRGQGTAYYYIYLDDVTLLVAPSCTRPNGVSVSDIGETSATLHINDPAFVGTYQVSLTVGDTTEELTVIDTVYTLDNLTASSRYTVSVSALCDDGNPTTAVSVAFKTLCGAIADLPWTENFDHIPSGSNIVYGDYELLPCWEMYTGAYDDASQSATLTPANTDVFTPNTYGMGGNMHLRVNIYGNSANNLRWLVTPAIALGDEGTLSFDYAVTGYNSSSAPSSTGSDDRLLVLATTDGGTTWNRLYAFGTGDDFDIQMASIAATATTATIDLGEYAGQTIRIAFYGESTVTNADIDFHIDNIRVSGTPGEQPERYNVSVATANPAMGSATATHSGMVDAGTSVTFTATAAQGYHFASWTDATGTEVSTANPYTASISADLALTANFEADSVPPVGIGAVQGLAVGLVPNPASTSVRVGFEGQATVELIDLQGRTLQSTRASGSATLDVSPLPRGTYYVRVSTPAATAVAKLVVR